MMTQTVELPLWLVVLGAALATWALVSRLLVPGVRWFFRQRANRVIADLNKRLQLRLPPIALTRRRALIERLTYDPKVMQAVAEYCEKEGAPREVAIAKVERYAREIVPAFNAYVYFRFGSWLSRRLARLLYRVRLGYADEESLRELDPEASLVFVMNHRSNMDYILVTYLAMQQTALSYAVGEWARVWPIQQLIRALGAYFVRRGSGNPLYRRVLERYVQIAVEGGATQAVFPEGGLSRDGLLRKPRIGLLDYMLRDFDPLGERDLIFIPVGINYDRVLADRTLLLDSNPAAERQSGSAAVRIAFWFLLQQTWMMMRRRWHRMGYACVNFGTPVSMREYLAARDWDLRRLEKQDRGERVTVIAQDLMSKVGDLVPVLPVSLVSHVFLDSETALTEDELATRAVAVIEELEAHGANVYLPRDDHGYTVQVGLRMLTLRHFVFEENGRYRIVPSEEKILRYYANAITHFFSKEPVETPSAIRPSRPPN